MSTISSFILGIFLLTLGCLYLGLWAIRHQKTNTEKLLKIITIGYCLATGLLLSLLIVYFIGITEDGGAIPRKAQRRIAHAGYYFSRDGELRLAGDRKGESSSTQRKYGTVRSDEDRSEEDSVISQLLPPEFSNTDSAETQEVVEDRFIHPALNASELINLRPVWNGDLAQQWNLTYRINTQPLRLQTTKNGEAVSLCVNVPDGWWLDQGDTLVLTQLIGNDLKFVSIRLDVGTKYPWIFKRRTNSYHFAQGTIRNNIEVYEKSPILMSERVLYDGITLDALVRRARKDFRSQVGTIGEEWWALFRNLTLVREQTGKSDSRIGLLVADGFFSTDGAGVYKRSSNGITRQWINNNAEPTTIQLPVTTIVSYGFATGRSSFQLKLTDQVTSDDVWGQVMRVDILRPRKWPLPPDPTKDFIVTSTTDYIPLDGYVIDFGDTSSAFYAKAHLGESLNDLYVNDGKNLQKDKTDLAGPRRFDLDDAAYLGNYQQGVLIKLMRSQSEDRTNPWLNSFLGPLKHTGRTAVLLIAVNSLALLILALRQKQNQLRPHLFLFWTIIWGIGLTILTVRLLLVYRVSLVPPLDASFAEIRGIFDKGVDYATLGLVAFAVITLSQWFASRRSRRSTQKTWMTVSAVVLWGLLIVVYTIAGGLTRTDQSLGIRINIADHLLIVLGLALLTKHVLEDPHRILRVIAAVIIVLAIALQILVVKDAGAVIYSCSLLLPVFLLLGWDRSKGILRKKVSSFVANHRIIRSPIKKLQSFAPVTVRRVSRLVASWVIPIIIAASPLFIILLSPYLTDRGIRKVIEPALPDTAFYRFASFTDTEDLILTTKSGEEAVDMSKLLENSQQSWQMLLYASQGAVSAKGYGQAPLSNTGMTYATSVSDCAFATYVLAEHGKWSAIVLLLLYAFLAYACLLSTLYLDDNIRSRSVALIAIAGFFAYNALYMAGANIGLLPFTGQNIPLLGLNSGGDLVQGLLLILLAGWLMLRTTQEVTPRNVWQSRPIIIKWGFGLTAAAFLLFISVLLRLDHIARSNEEVYGQDHALKKETLDTILKDLPQEGSANQNQPLLLNGERLDRPPGAQLMEIEEQYRKQFNDRTDKFNSNGGLYYLEQTRDAAGMRKLRIKVNERFIYARSPFKEPVMWRGEIVAGGDNEPTLYGLNRKRVTISIRNSGYPGSVDLSSVRSTHTTFSPQLRDGGRQFCELTRENNRLSLDPKKGDWAIFINGKKANVGTAIDLEPLSIIVIERREANYRRNLIYLGPTSPILAYVRWRNGQERRMFPEESLFLPYFIGKAADQVKVDQAKLPAAEQKLGDRLTLTVDVGLHRTLQTYLIEYAKAHSNYSPFRQYPNRLGATVLDAFSGRTLALASWPLTNPNTPDYDILIDKIPQPTRSRLEDNANFSRHVVGSTIKPVVLATMATTMWPSRDLSRLTVYNRASAYTGALNSGEVPVHPHLQVGGIRIDLWDCNSPQAETDMQNFIVNSLDYPEGVLGMLGIVKTVQEFDSVLTPSTQRNADVLLDGTPYTLDLMRASEDGTALSLQDQREGRLPFTRGEKSVNDTILYRGLSEVFDFKCSGSSEDRLAKASEAFFPSFNNSKTFANNSYLDNIIASRLDMGGGDFQGIRQGFLSCLLGGEPCGFNNIMMAEAAARLATGTRVFSRLEDSPVAVPTELPAPLDNNSHAFGSQELWRLSNIVRPMELVGQTGTARYLAFTRAPFRVTAPYRALFKTGTIVEGNEGRESEALMFVIGRWDNGGFVRGETISGFLYMEKSKVKNPPGQQVADGDMKKFAFAAPLLSRLVDYLRSTRATP